MINKHETVFIQNALTASVPVSSLHGKSSSTGNLLEREDVAAPVPEYAVHSHMAAQSAASLHGRQQRPYSMVVPGFSQVGLPHPPAVFTPRTALSFGVIRARLTHKVSVRPGEKRLVSPDDRHADRHLWLSERKEVAECGPIVLSAAPHFPSYISP